MKRIIFLSIACLLLLAGKLFSEGTESRAIPQDGTITVVTSPDLVKLSTLWAKQYQVLHPDVKIEVTEMNDEMIPAILQSEGSIGLISKRYSGAIPEESKWQMTVGRDIIVPVINAKNPFIEKINLRGITSEKLAMIFTGTETPNWKTILESEQNASLNFYLVNDETIIAGVADFLNITQSVMHGNTVQSPEEMVAAIQKDPLAIGFCRLVDIMDANTSGIVQEVQLMPIDKNGNGKMDSFEQIYASLNDLAHGIWIGKYPKSLVANIYSVSTELPKDESQLAFLKWILTDGQQYLTALGYCDLERNEIMAKVDNLYENNIAIEKPVVIQAKFKAIILIFVGVIVLGLFINAIIRYSRKRKKTIMSEIDSIPGIFNEQTVRTPGGLFFDKSHTWAFMEKDGYVKIGVDDFLQHVTGSVTRVDMKNPGERIKKGDVLFSIIQNGKQLNIKSPISGNIIEKNRALLTHSTLINSNPYTDGWVYSIEPINWLREIQFMSMAEKYREWLKGEFIRLKDFFASLQTNQLKYAHIVLQDGGELKDGILTEFGPEVWEDFQSNFIEKSK